MQAAVSTMSISGAHGKIQIEMTYKANHTKLDMSSGAQRFELGSVNVFADLGLRNAEGRFSKIAASNQDCSID